MTTMITTIHGEMDEVLLEKRTGSDDSVTDVADWVEYWYEGILVHRSVHVHIKEGPSAMIEAAAFN